MAPRTRSARPGVVPAPAGRVRGEHVARRHHTSARSVQTPADAANVSSSLYLILPAELLQAVLSSLPLQAVLSCRLACCSLHAAASDPDVWRGIATHFLRAHPHLWRPATHLPLGVSGIRWFARLQRAARLRFLRGGAQREIAGELQIAGFGDIFIEEDSPDLAFVDYTGLCAFHGAFDEQDRRAELLVPEGVGPLQLRVEMSDMDGYIHLIYLRRGAEGCACYWDATRGGNTLRLDGRHCAFEQDSSAGGHHLRSGTRQKRVRPDRRLLKVDPGWREGLVPSGDEQLYVGVTLFNENSFARLRWVELHDE